MRLRVPPGRAGRLWLRSRLASARNAAELLDHKRRELEGELRRMETIEGRRRRAWSEAMTEARRWLARVDATNGGQAREVAAALETGSAEVTLEWRNVIGVRYPTEFSLRLPPTPNVISLDGGAAVGFATDASGKAVQAGVAHAVARTARDRIKADLDRTIRRLRALNLRAIPALEEALRVLEVALDEKDREEAVAARWAQSTIAPPVPGGEVS